MALTNKVIFINDVKQEDEKPVVFTHYLNDDKWYTASKQPNHIDNIEIIYLGKLVNIGDAFLVKRHKNTLIYKGHLNSGKY
jgi:hypothetical protein